MNISETDADGWTYVRFGDAAKAVQDGAHELRRRYRERTTMKEALRESVRLAGIGGSGVVRL